LSEFTISSDRANRAYNFSVSRKEQARWVRAAFRLVNKVDYVAGLGQRARLAANARVVHDRLVQQHADPHAAAHGALRYAENAGLRRPE
jgi:hypothetical protein